MILFIKCNADRQSMSWKEGMHMNAIILAAGVGLRMRAIAQAGHKALMPIGGIPIIERTIQYLQAAGISDITIVTGHMCTLFTPLERMYGVKLLVNQKYSVNNNLYSMELILDRIHDTYLIHGDVILFKNVFMQKEQSSFFYTILKESKGIPLPYIQTDKKRIIQGYATYAGKDTITTLLGISYWTQQDAQYLRAYFHAHVNEKLKRRYHMEWEDTILGLSDEIVIEAHQLDRKYARDVNLMRDFMEARYVYDQYWKKEYKI